MEIIRRHWTIFQTCDYHIVCEKVSVILGATKLRRCYPDLTSICWQHVTRYLFHLSMIVQLNAVKADLQALVVSRPQPQFPKQTFKHISPSASSFWCKMRALSFPSQPFSTPITTTHNIASTTSNATSTPTSNPYNRKIWTATELDYLCCLKLHTSPTYAQIKNLMEQKLGSVPAKHDAVRYNTNVLSCHLPPTQKGRRARALAADPRW